MLDTVQNSEWGREEAPTADCAGSRAVPIKSTAPDASYFNFWLFYGRSLGAPGFPGGAIAGPGGAFGLRTVSSL